MKQKVLASTLSICTFVTSFIWMHSGSARAVIFEPPPDNRAPRRAKGGASRGNIKFVPTLKRQTPNRGSGNASRGILFTPKSGNETPKTGAGGASRGDLFTPKSGNETPKTGAGGASRNDSLGPNSKNIKPQSNPTAPAAILPVLPQSFFGTTVSERPNIFVYLPESTAKEAIFSLKDAHGNTLHEINLPVSGKAEVISLEVPVTLEVEQNYQWFLALKIDGLLSPRTPYVDGWIQRILPNPELLQAMQEKDELKQATAFGKHGVWYDCIATLAKLRTKEPNNEALNQHWSELLASVQLKEIDKAPIVSLKN